MKNSYKKTIANSHNQVNILGFVITLLTVLLFSLNGMSQLYTITTGSGSNPLAPNSGSSYNTGGDASYSGWNKIDVSSVMSTTAVKWSPLQLMPFAFELNGTAVTSYKVSSNGLITFGTTSGDPVSCNTAIPTSNLPNNTICVFWDCFSGTLGSNDDIYWRTYGSAPNRQIYIKWHSFKQGVNSYSYYQCVLEETTNKVYIVDSKYRSSSGSGTLGIQENSSSAVQYSSNYALLLEEVLLQIIYITVLLLLLLVHLLSHTLKILLQVQHLQELH